MINITNEDNMALMSRYPDKYFDLAVVDPPYGIGLIKTKAGNWGIRKEAKGDIQKDWDFQKPTKQYFDELFRVSKNQIIWGANHFIETLNKNSSCWIVWDKQNGDSYFADSELAWTSFDCVLRKVTYDWIGLGYCNSSEKGTRIHPTHKPVFLYDWILQKYAKPNDLILDTHLGSGSSRIAAYKGGFNFVGFEIDKDYYDKQEKRFNDFKSQLRLF